MTDESRGQSGYLRQAWLVLVLALAYGGALAGVQTTLAPRIEENKRQETYRVIPRLIPGAVQESTEEILLTLEEGAVERIYRTHDAAGTHNGWVVSASGQGFADKIELLVGLDPNLATITGLYVLDQKETPGLGDYIRGDEFLDRFRLKSTETPLAAVKSQAALPHEIEALSGATVSSWSVCNITNDAVARLRVPILQEAEKSNNGRTP
jgi:electron transport complex protein RnfG